MTIEQIAASAADTAAAELLAAEAEVTRLEEEVARTRDAVTEKLTLRAGLQTTLGKLPPRSPAITRLERQLHELRHAEGPLTLAVGNLREAKYRVDNLRLELDELRWLAAPPPIEEPAQAEEAAGAFTVVEVVD